MDRERALMFPQSRKIARMHEGRLPVKLQACWAIDPRHIGRPKQTLRHTAAEAIQAIVPDLPSDAPLATWHPLARDEQEWTRSVTAHKQPPPPSPLKPERARVPLHRFQKGVLRAVPEHPNLRAAADATGYAPPSPSSTPSSPPPTPPPTTRRRNIVDEVARARAANARASRATPPGEVGYRFEKYFPGHGWFDGEVAEIHSGTGEYRQGYRRCEYADGDSEDLTLRQLRTLAKRAEKRLAAAT